MDQVLAYVQEQGIFLLRLVIAACCGLLIGIERENRMKDAGIRTHLMVAVASALMMVVSKYGFFDVLSMSESIKLDPSRVASGIVTGIGFIGAGTIFVRKQAVSGLTTAAGLWATVGIGMALGAGQYFLGIAVTLLILLFQMLLHRNVRIFRNAARLLVIQTVNRPGIAAELRDLLEKEGARVVSMKTATNSRNDLEVELGIKLPKNLTPVNLCAQLQQLADVKAIEF